ncbi:alpha/beta hydrolase family protein [Brevundimonas sp. TWP2-3-4b2]|uniref:alpha/beta hydrolase family protein n=1 Tax=Brevundimonas sp. TWP2-3-4b2 TaxID=2804595 RepID=UPI003CF1E5EB
MLILRGRDDTAVPFELSRVFAEALRQAGKPYGLVERPSEDYWLTRAATRPCMRAETVRFWRSTIRRDRADPPFSLPCRPASPRSRAFAYRTAGRTGMPGRFSSGFPIRGLQRPEEPATHSKRE